MPATKEQSDWIARVLGFRSEAATTVSPQQALDASISSLTAKAAKLAGAPRPSAPPRQQATEKLLGSMISRPAPEDAADAPAHVAAFLPDFLVSVEAERPAASQNLEAGSAIPAADQLLGIADLFAATQRAMIEWENLLEQTETADSTIDVIEEEEEQERDESEYAQTLVTYNASRKQAITAETAALKLMAELQAAFNSLPDSAQAAALKEAGADA